MRGYADVLGEPLTLNVRTSGYRELLRTNEILTGLRAVADAGPGLRVVAVPSLGTDEFHVAALLKATPDGVPQAHLPALLRRRIGDAAEGLQSDEARRSMQRDAEALADPRTLAGVVGRLRAQGLVEDRPDALVRATPRLRLIHV